MSVRGQLLGCWVEHAVQRQEHALVRQTMCGGLKVLVRGSRDGSHSEAHRIPQNAGRA